LPVGLEKKNLNKRQTEILRQQSKEYASKLSAKEKYKAEIKEKEDYWIITFAFYQYYTAKKQEENFFKKIASKNIKLKGRLYSVFKSIAILLFLVLALLTYYPLIKYLLMGLLQIL